MGKGDRKTTKGKRYASSYGNTRARGEKPAATPAADPVRVAAPAKAAAKKAPVRKKA